MWHGGWKEPERVSPRSALICIPVRRLQTSPEKQLGGGWVPPAGNWSSKGKKQSAGRSSQRRPNGVSLSLIGLFFPPFVLHVNLGELRKDVRDDLCVQEKQKQVSPRARSLLRPDGGYLGHLGGSSGPGLICDTKQSREQSVDDVRFTVKCNICPPPSSDPPRLRSCESVWLWQHQTCCAQSCCTTYVTHSSYDRASVCKATCDPT